MFQSSDSRAALDVVSIGDMSYENSVWTWRKIAELMQQGHLVNIGWIKAHEFQDVVMEMKEMNELISWLRLLQVKISYSTRYQSHL